MKVFSHFSVYGFSNIYLIGPENGGDAILIDPGIMDVHLLNLIENNGYSVRNVLVTHAHENHIRGLKTLLKIYDARIYSRYPNIPEITSLPVKDGEVLSIEEPRVDITAIEIPGHSNDSLVYHMKDMLFTGDVLSAGHIGQTSNGYAKGNLLAAVRKRILPLDPYTVLFPGHGPPSLLKSELAINQEFKQKF